MIYFVLTPIHLSICTCTPYFVKHRMHSTAEIYLDKLALVVESDAHPTCDHEVMGLIHTS